MPEPVISLLSALLFIVVLVTAAKVESPLRNVDELAVPDPNLAVGTVPDAKSDASKFVRFAPLIAGNVPVIFAAGKLVKLAPDPLNVVAVHTPVANISPSGLKVTPEPTLVVLFAVSVLVVRVVTMPVVAVKVVTIPVTILVVPVLSILNLSVLLASLV